MNMFTKAAAAGVVMMSIAGTASADASKSIAENAIDNGSFTTLIAAAQAAGLADALMGEGDFTVFAPTDEAFAALPAGTVESLLLPENKDALVALLSAHVIPVSVEKSYFDLAAVGNTDIALNNQDIEAFDGGLKLDSIGNTDVNVMKQASTYFVMTNDPTLDNTREAAEITIADIESSNGVIHVIDQVLQPRT